MQLDSAIHISLIQKRLSDSYQPRQQCDFSIFLWVGITIMALVLQLIWYYNTSWVSNIGNLVLVMNFWFRIIKSEWFCILLKDRKWLKNML